MNPYFGFLFAITTLIVAIPSAMKVYNWLLTGGAASGSPRRCSSPSAS